MKPLSSLNRRRMRRYVVQGVALGAVASVLVVFFTSGAETLDHLRAFSPRWLPLLFGMVALAWCCNGARVWLMCRAAGHPLRYARALTVSLSSEFGIAATPAGVGGTVIRLALLRQAGVPLTTAGSLLAADAAVDLVFFALLAPFAGFILLRGGLLDRLLDSPTEMDALVVVLVLLATAALLIVLLRSRSFHRAVHRALAATRFGRTRRLPGRHRHLRITVGRSVRRVFASLAFLWRHRKGALLANLALASTQWCCRYLLLPMLLFAFGVSVNPLPLFLVQGLLFGVSLLVVAPGGGGSVELLSAIILPNLAPTAVVGVVVVLWRFFTYHLYLLGGGLVFFYACQRPRDSSTKGGAAFADFEAGGPPPKPSAENAGNPARPPESQRG